MMYWNTDIGQPTTLVYDTEATTITTTTRVSVETPPEPEPYLPVFVPRRPPCSHTETWRPKRLDGAPWQALPRQAMRPRGTLRPGMRALPIAGEVWTR